MDGDGLSQSVLGGDPYAPLTFANSSLSPISSPVFTHSWSSSFCHDPEGWGPISSRRFDLTPCALDLTVAFVALWGVLGGFGALYMLIYKRIAQPVSKNWHFYAKMVWDLSLTVARFHG